MKIKMQKEVKEFISLDDPLIQFSKEKKDSWTLRDAVRGVQIFGGIGSGKTSGSGKMIAKCFLENELGGVVLCAKPDERENWIRMIKEAGRESDLIIFEEGGKYFFNPLDYEINREGKGAGDSYNLVNLFMNIYQMGRAFSGEGMAKEADRFWDNALKRCLRRMIDLLKLANEKVSVLNMQLLLTSALSSDEIDRLNRIRGLDDNNEAYDELMKWSKENYYIKCYVNALKNYGETSEKASEELSETKFTIHLLQNYFEREFSNLADKTKTIIVESFLGIAEPFLGGILKKHFANITNIYPEQTYKEGKIIILDFPIKNYLDAGIYAQGIFKLLFQQALERRNYRSGIDRPVFFWADESQFFLSDYDQTFQTTARSSGTCTVFLSQNISNYYAAMGGRNPKPRVDSLLANLSTKIFHANNDSVTNEWAANTIGRNYRIKRNFSMGDSESYGGSEDLIYQVNPTEFTIFKTGGHENNYEVEGIVTVAGKKWSNEKNYLKLLIPQN